MNHFLVQYSTKNRNPFSISLVNKRFKGFVGRKSKAYPDKQIGQKPWSSYAIANPSILYTIITWLNFKRHLIKKSSI